MAWAACSVAWKKGFVITPKGTPDTKTEAARMHGARVIKDGPLDISERQAVALR